MNIALIAHDKKKELMIQFCTAYKGVLEKHSLFATGTTGKVLIEETGMDVYCFLPGAQGGAHQIASCVAYNEIDLVIYFRDSSLVEKNDSDVMVIMRHCDMNNIPIATNLATAEIMIHGIERGDFDWRDIVNPKK